LQIAILSQADAFVRRLVALWSQCDCHHLDEWPLSQRQNWHEWDVLLVDGRLPVRPLPADCHIPIVVVLPELASHRVGDWLRQGATALWQQSQLPVMHWPFQLPILQQQQQLRMQVDQLQTVLSVRYEALVQLVDQQPLEKLSPMEVGV
jgi:hypothetical protein